MPGIHPPTQEAQSEQTARAAVAWSLLALLLLLFFSASAFLLLARELTGLNDFDLGGLYWARRLHDRDADLAMALLTWLGGSVGLSLQMLLLGSLLVGLRPKGWRWDLLLVLLALLGSALLNHLLKTNFQRLRPALFPGPFMLSTYSFPSGHAMSSTCFYGALAWVLVSRLRGRPLRLLAILDAALLVAGISFSRVYFAVHYPTDVAGGIVAGLAWLLLSIGITRALYRSLQRRRLAETQPPGIQ